MTYGSIEGTCSQECKRANARNRAAERFLAEEIARPCKGCGITLRRVSSDTAKYGMRLLILCDACSIKNARESRRASKAMRRARMKNNGPHESIKPSLIFDRDNWTCQLCGDELNSEDKVPSAKAATLDHIMPLANGGTHTVSNVQCACFECNWRKADNAIEVDGEVLWDYAHCKQYA